MHRIETTHTHTHHSAYCQEYTLLQTSQQQFDDQLTTHRVNAHIPDNKSGNSQRKNRLGPTIRNRVEQLTYGTNDVHKR